MSRQRPSARGGFVPLANVKWSWGSTPPCAWGIPLAFNTGPTSNSTADNQPNSASPTPWLRPMPFGDFGRGNLMASAYALLATSVAATLWLRPMPFSTPVAATSWLRPNPLVFGPDTRMTAPASTPLVGSDHKHDQSKVTSSHSSRRD
ncbi:hypothetical protein RhiJN_24045 [Ceratobasidium sp. AG-Ba]|nr:hypothetical protein RhiJN_24045 [Ceratobasidium sp. AG-Ba]